MCGLLLKKAWSLAIVRKLGENVSVAARRNNEIIACKRFYGVRCRSVTIQCSAGRNPEASWTTLEKRFWIFCPFVSHKKYYIIKTLNARSGIDVTMLLIVYCYKRSKRRITLRARLPFETKIAVYTEHREQHCILTYLDDKKSKSDNTSQTLSKLMSMCF